MPSGIEISSELNDYRLQGVINFLATGAGNAYADIYPAPRVAFRDPPGAAKLTRIYLVEPLGTLPGNGTLAVSPTDEALVLVSGVAAWARICNGEDVIGWDCDVSDNAGRGQLKLASTTLYAGGGARILSGTLA